nr:MAG TPA: hypothetical protein [Bacteriophage sp.]
MSFWKNMVLNKLPSRFQSMSTFCASINSFIGT